MAAAATARKTAPARKPPARKSPALKAVPARKPTARKKATATATVPARRRAPARKAAPSRRQAPTRRPGGQLIPLAVGTASKVRHLPDSSLMVRMTRGRAWIGVLGVLLAGIVALNVVTLSLAASVGQIDQNIQALDQENSILRGRDAQKSGSARVRHDAAGIGLVVPTTDQIAYAEASPQDVAVAAQRLEAAGSGY